MLSFLIVICPSTLAFTIVSFVFALRGAKIRNLAGYKASKILRYAQSGLHRRSCFFALLIICPGGTARH